MDIISEVNKCPKCGAKLRLNVNYQFKVIDIEVFHIKEKK